MTREMGRLSTGRLEQMPRRKVQFVLKTSKFCNLRCRYCYEFPELGNRSAVSPAQFRALYRSIADHYYRVDGATDIDFDWHGGEPLLVDPDVYWETFDDQTKIFDDPKVRVKNLLQTNLTILDDRRVKLLYEGFDSVGVSLDLFSGLRVNAGGRDAEPAVLENMDRLQQTGIPFGCITVLSRRNRPHLSKIFRFFAEASLPVRILPLFRGADAEQNTDFQLSEREVLEAFIALFEMWADRPAKVVIEPLHSYIEAVLASVGGRRVKPYDKSAWEAIYVVNTDGGLYSYADLYEPALSHGNLFTEALGELVNGSRHRRAIAAAAARIEASCQDCRHFGRACTGYPAAEESGARDDLAPNGARFACTRERGLFDYLERRLLELDLVDAATGRVNKASKYYARFGLGRNPPQ